MKIEIMVQIINEHLKGRTVRDIGEELGISKDTVNNVLKEWRNGRIAHMQNAVPDEESTVELARFMKNHSITLEEIPEAIVHLSELHNMGYSPERILFVFKVLANMTPYDANLLIDTVRSMKEHNVKLPELSSTVNELEGKKVTLTDQVGKLEQRKNDLDIEIKEKESKIAEQDKIVESKNKEIQVLEKNKYMQKDKLERSEKYWENAKKLGINSDDLEYFMEEAIDFDYNMDQLNEADYILRSLGNVKNKPEIISKIFDAVLSMDESGWDIESFIRMASGIKNIKGSKDETVKAFSNLERELSEISKGVEEKKKEKDALAGKVNALEAGEKIYKKRLAEMNNEKTRIEASVKSSEEKLEKSRSELKDIEVEKNKAESLIRSGYAVVNLMKEGKIDHVYLSIFAHPEELNLSDDQRKTMRDDLRKLLLQIYREDFGIIEFEDKKTMKIIDGKDYKNALETVKQAKAVEKMRKDTMDIIDRYGDDHVAFIADVLLGKPGMKGEVPGIIMKRVEQKIEENVSVQLSILIREMDTKSIIKGFPVQIQSNGRLTIALVRNEDFIMSLMNNYETVSATTVEKSYKTEIRTFLAMKFMLLGLIDPRFDSNLRAELRKISEKLSKGGEDKFILTPVLGIISKHVV